MIIIDISNIMIANIMVNLYQDSNYILNEGLLRHSILNSVIRFKQKFEDEYGKVVVACDSPAKSWRLRAFPNYKARRRKDKAESEFDWGEINTYMSMIRGEMRRHLPFPVVEVEGAEADDIIAAMVQYFPMEKHMIVSRDKDMRQLQIYGNVRQYDPVSDKYLDVDDPVKYLFEHICKGDVSDGIPNILSDEDTFIVEGKRQKPVTQKKLDAWFADLNTLPSTYFRNKRLIDLTQIPNEIFEGIIEDYLRQKSKKPNLMKYFMDYGLAAMLDKLPNFY